MDIWGLGFMNGKFIYKLLGKFLILLLIISAATGSLEAGNFKMVAGEELIYEVSYMGISLGTIKVVTLGRETINGQKVYKVKSYIDSYNGIPFVSIHSVYESWIDPSISYSHYFKAQTKAENYTIYDNISFDYVGKHITHTQLHNTTEQFKKNFDHDKKWNDGLSLLFFPRKYLMINRTIKVPTFIDDKSNTTIKFFAGETKTEIDAVDYPVSTKQISGVADFTGIYGVTGKFKGWFSNDDARVPIRAEMKLMIGNAVIELKEWKRKGWNPPKAK